MAGWRQRLYVGKQAVPSSNLPLTRPPSTQVWRHLAWVFDETTDQVTSPSVHTVEYDTFIKFGLDWLICSNFARP